MCRARRNRTATIPTPRVRTTTIRWPATVTPVHYQLAAQKTRNKKIRTIIKANFSQPHLCGNFAQFFDTRSARQNTDTLGIFRFLKIGVLARPRNRIVFSAQLYPMPHDERSFPANFTLFHGKKINDTLRAPSWKDIPGAKPGGWAQYPAHGQE